MRGLEDIIRLNKNKITHKHVIGSHIPLCGEEPDFIKGYSVSSSTLLINCTKCLERLKENDTAK